MQIILIIQILISCKLTLQVSFFGGREFGMRLYNTSKDLG